MVPSGSDAALGQRLEASLRALEETEARVQATRRHGGGMGPSPADVIRAWRDSLREETGDE